MVAALKYKLVFSVFCLRGLLLYLIFSVIKIERCVQTLDDPAVSEFEGNMAAKRILTTLGWDLTDTVLYFESLHEYQTLQGYSRSFTMVPDCAALQPQLEVLNGGNDGAGRGPTEAPAPASEPESILPTMCVSVDLKEMPSVDGVNEELYCTFHRNTVRSG